MPNNIKFPDELTDVVRDLPRFEQALLQLAERLELDLTVLEADHIALRCHQIVTAERWKAGLLQAGELLSEKLINGRPICLFRLYQPLQVAGWLLKIVELPWPGKRHYRDEGWEHVEIVLPGDPATLGAHAMGLLSNKSLSAPDLSFKTRLPAGENERLSNPTLAVTDGRTTIKFHPWRLEEIIISELS